MPNKPTMHLNEDSTDSIGDNGVSSSNNNMNINYSNNSNDCQDTFFILQILTQIMRIYYDNDEKLMKDEVLITFYV